MPRANRYFVPGMVYHLTHRCHDKAFLLRFKQDRSRYIQWLFEAKKRFGLSILNFIVTSNHVHILVHDNGRPNAIERSMQLAQGSFAQDYNTRNGRFGAFWQDRYHATIVQTGAHLRRCMTYIDMNMVRAGVVSNPFDWASAGLHHIQDPPMRYRLLDLNAAKHLMGFDSTSELAEWQMEKLLQSIGQPCQREEKWTGAVAVGNPEFLQRIQDHLGMRARRRKLIEVGEGAVLQEPSVRYRISPIKSNSKH